MMRDQLDHDLAREEKQFDIDEMFQTRAEYHAWLAAKAEHEQEMREDDL